MSFAGSIFDARSARTRDRSGARLVTGPNTKRLSEVEQLTDGILLQILQKNSGHFHHDAVVPDPWPGHLDQLSFIELITKVVGLYEPVELRHRDQRLRAHDSIVAR